MINMAIEGEEKEKLRLTEQEANTFAYSLEIVNAALMFGWDIKIFKDDPRLLHLAEILQDNEISPDVFFNLREFSEKKGIRNAYEWAREVQKNVFDKYDLGSEENRDNFINRLNILDSVYEHGDNPKKVLGGEELDSFSSQCEEYIHKALSMPFSS